MTYNTPVLTDRVPYTWDELKAHAIESNPSHRTVRPTPREVPAAAFAGMTAQAQGASLKPLGEANTMQVARPAPVQAPVVKTPEVQPAQPVVQPAPVQAPAAAAPVMDAKLVDEIVQAVVPLIMERLHAQVSIMVDMTMKQAASKIRNDFDNALKMTVQSAVQKVVEDKISH